MSAVHLHHSDKKLGCGATERCNESDESDESDENDKNDETTKRGTEVADNILYFSACPFIRLSVRLFVATSVLL